MPTFAPAPFACVAVLLLCFAENSEAATTVVTRDFVIAYAASAPPTTVLAAQELRRVIAKVDGLAPRPANVFGVDDVNARRVRQVLRPGCRNERDVENTA